MTAGLVEPGSVAASWGPAWLVVTVAGAAVPLRYVGPLTIRQGRAAVDDPPTPATLTAQLDTAGLAQLPELGADVVVELGPDGAAALGLDARSYARARARFVGTVTDAQLVAAPDPADPAWLTLTAVAPAAALRRHIGDTPWPAESDGARAARVLAAAGAVDVDRVDAGTVTVRARDVDRRPALELLTQLGADSGGLLQLDRDGFASWHDALHRRNAPTGVQLRAADVLRDATWSLSLDGVANDVTVVYGDPVVEADGSEGDRPRTSYADPVSVARHGRLDVELETELVQAADAERTARHTAGRRGRPRWRIAGLAVDLVRTLAPRVAGQLLQAEPGELVRVVDLPAGPYRSAHLWAEGWTETITRREWRLALDVADYGLAAAPPRWLDVDPATSWADVPADVTWLSAVGWSTHGDPGRWTDVPRYQRWTDVDPTLTWTAAAV